jgi:hypothetical protein
VTFGTIHHPKITENPRPAYPLPIESCHVSQIRDTHYSTKNLRSGSGIYYFSIFILFFDNICEYYSRIADCSSSACLGQRRPGQRRTRDSPIMAIFIDEDLIKNYIPKPRGKQQC